MTLPHDGRPFYLRKPPPPILEHEVTDIRMSESGGPNRVACSCGFQATTHDPESLDEAFAAHRPSRRRLRERQATKLN